MSDPTQKIKAIFEQERERVVAVRAAVGISETSPVKHIAEHSVNVFTIDIEDRKTLLGGPTIDIIADSVIVRKDVAVRALIASCQRVHDIVHIKSEVDWFRVGGQVEKKSIEDLLDTFTTPKLYRMNCAELSTGHFSKDVKVYQACLALGIHYSHTIPLLNDLRGVITSRLLTLDELDILASRFSASNPLMKHVATDLCRRRLQKEIPRITEFETWLSGKSKQVLKKVMLECEKERENRRQAVIERKRGRGEDMMLRSWGERVDKVHVGQEGKEEDMEITRSERRDSKSVE